MIKNEKQLKDVQGWLIKFSIASTILTIVIWVSLVLDQKQKISHGVSQALLYVSLPLVIITVTGLFVTSQDISLYKFHKQYLYNKNDNN